MATHRVEPAGAGPHVVEIVPAEAGHIRPVAAAMRQADRDEVWASARSTPLRALKRSLAISPLAWAGLLDGAPVCLFGVGAVSLLSGIGSPWLLGTDAIEANAMRFLRRNRAMVGQMLAAFPVLANHVDARNHLSIRWLRWLGFTLAPAVPYGPFGLPFHPFEMRR